MAAAAVQAFAEPQAPLWQRLWLLPAYCVPLLLGIWAVLRAREKQRWNAERAERRQGTGKACVTPSALPSARRPPPGPTTPPGHMRAPGTPGGARPDRSSRRGDRSSGRGPSR